MSVFHVFSIRFFVVTVRTATCRFMLKLCMFPKIILIIALIITMITLV